MNSRIRNLDDFLTLLRGAKQARDGQYLALCPGHNDTKPSLSIKQAEGKIFLKCFAGCKLENILKSLRLEPKDLTLDRHKSKLHLRKIEAVYCYIDASGKPFEVVRTVPKGFYQRKLDGKGNYVNNLRGIIPSLYHQDKIKQAINTGTLVYFVEGEKDVDRLWGLGLVATTNPMGAGKWHARYTEALRGADLIIIPDNDGPGHDHAEHVAKSCYGIADRIRMLELPDGSKDTTDWLDHGGSVEQLKRLVNSCPEYKFPPDITLPEIVVNDRDLRDITTDALEALYKVNRPERIFRRGGEPTRISLDENQRPHTEAVDEFAFRGCLARTCNFRRITAKGNRTAVPPPLDVVRDCLKLRDWQFPALLGITEAPVIRPDGTVITKPGYDNLTGLYYYPSPKLSVPLIPDKPSDADVKAAVNLVLDPLADLPFDSEASRANAIAAMLTPILRPTIDGLLPLALVDKPQPGTGAGLFADIVSLIATGQLAATMGAPRSEEEWEKKLSSQLLSGRNICVIDNVEGRLQSDTLSRYLTSPFVSVRPFHRLADIVLPNKLIFLANGNNIRLGGDLPRRCFWIRMDAKMARPWLRPKSDFRHDDLRKWVSENRGAILAAILTITRAWVLANMPEAQGLLSLGGFESYCRIVGGVMAYMGVSGFLENLDVMYNETDTETPQWEGFLSIWHDILGNKAVTTTELINHIYDNVELRAALPDTISDIESRNYIRRLGNALAKKRDVRFPNGFSIVKAGEYNRAAKWQIMSPTKADSYQSTFNYESSESGSNLTDRKNENGNDKNLCRNKPQQDSEDSYLASKKHESCPDDIAPYPTHSCPKCGSEWAVSSRGQYVCDTCSLLHPSDCDLCQKEKDK